MGDNEQVHTIPLPKSCCTCKKVKLALDFSRSRSRKDGLDAVCRACKSEAHRLRMKADPDYMNRRYRESHDEFMSTMKVDPDVIARLEKRLSSEMKSCPSCETSKPLTEFYIRIRNGRHICIRTNCKGCHNRKTAAAIKPANAAFMRYRASAARRGLGFDLTLDFVRECLDEPCVYCGDDSILVTIDRADNAVGYVESNCVPCCIRCNLVKADMPLAAWTEVAKSMRTAREAGLFGGWAGRKNFNRKDITL